MQHNRFSIFDQLTCDSHLAYCATYWGYLQSIWISHIIHYTRPHKCCKFRLSITFLQLDFDWHWFRLTIRLRHYFSMCRFAVSHMMLTRILCTDRLQRIKHSSVASNCHDHSSFATDWFARHRCRHCQPNGSNRSAATISLTSPAQLGSPQLTRLICLRYLADRFLPLDCPCCRSQVLIKWWPAARLPLPAAAGRAVVVVWGLLSGESPLQAADYRYHLLRAASGRVVIVAAACFRHCHRHRRQGGKQEGGN